ncbi:Hypothetical protein i Rubrerythrin cluster [hydrothermal vent metagenome]|uniref:DUF3501 domain-containing protein n=1 Tax=hydrothermal vent metagenome TaxID=652676 RepID=A0A3B0WHV5_9ZZZZ
MQKLTRKDLYSLEEYAAMRDDYRKKIMAHKKNRRLELGENILLSFEDKLIMQYQVQEMLKAEKIFEADGIEEELAAYNPLIPDGTNWKATMLIQYPDVEERQKKLTQLIGIENKIWLQVEGFDKVYAIADEDLERDTEEKTSAVHFMRYELDGDMVNAVKTGAAISAGVEHENYQTTVSPITANVRNSLASDLA